MRTSVISILLALSVVAGAGLIVQPGTAVPARPSETSGQPVDTPKTGTTLPAPANPPKWPIAFGDATAPSARVNASNQLQIAPIITNASPEALEVIVKVALRFASGAEADTTVTCPPPKEPPLKEPTSKPGTGQLTSTEATPEKPIPPSSSCKFIVPANQAVLHLPLTIRVNGAARDAYPLNGVVAMWPATAEKKWSEEQPRATLALSNIPLESPPTVDWAIVAGSARWAFGAVLVGLLVCLVLWGSPFRRMGSATFSFTESWSGALMIGTPLLTAFLTTFTSFPDHAQTMSKKSYLLLSILLSAIIALAPALFNLWKLPTQVTNADGTVETQNQGLVLFFFVAAFVALTGGLGQLRLLGYVIVDLAGAAFFSTDLRNSLTWTVGALFWLVLVVSIVSMVTTVAAATAKPAVAQPRVQAPIGAQLQTAANAPDAGTSTRLPTWSLP
jgi:hypothetical protein